MKILIIAPRFPFPLDKGDRLTVFNLLKYFSERHEVSLVCFWEPDQEPEWVKNVKPFCEYLEIIPFSKLRAYTNCFVTSLGRKPLQMQYYLDPIMAKAVNRIVHNMKPDLLYAHTIRMGQYIAPYNDCIRILAMQISMSLNYRRLAKHSSGRLSQLLYSIEYRKLKSFEAEFARQFDRVLLISKRDLKEIEQGSPLHNVFLSPHGVDFDYFSPDPSVVKEPNSLILTGNMNYPANVAAALYFYNEIFPQVRRQIPDVKLNIVGADPAPEIQALGENKQVAVTGRVPDLRVYMNRAQIAIAPLRIGAGLQNKVLEGMSMGMPMVLTSIANEGIQAIHEENVVIADSASYFANRIVRLLRNEQDRHELGSAAREFIVNNWSWESHLSDLERMLTDLVVEKTTVEHMPLRQSLKIIEQDEVEDNGGDPDPALVRNATFDPGMNAQTDIRTAAPIANERGGMTLMGKSRHKFKRLPTSFSERRALWASVDGLLVLLAMVVALIVLQLNDNIYFDSVGLLKSYYLFFMMLAGWWAVAWLNDLYDVPSSNSVMRNGMRVLMAGCLLGAVCLVMSFLIPSGVLPRPLLFYFFLFALPAIILWHCLWATLSKILPSKQRILIVGHRERALHVAKTLRKASTLSYQVMGYVDDNLNGRATADDGLPLWDRSKLLDLAQGLHITEVVVAKEQELERTFFQSLLDCRTDGVRVSLMSDLHERLYRKTPIEHIDPGWALQAIANMRLRNRLLLASRRIFDLIFGIVGFAFLMLLLPIVGLAIRLDSVGPVFYRQRRCGRGGKPFSIIKFRTMCSNAETNGEAVWAAENDVRITRIGKYLRKARLDELPQVINILQGDMSVAGPRPERPEFVETLGREIPFYLTRLLVKPGITGWAQVHSGYGNTMRDASIKLEYDFYYLRNWSLWLDLYIIFRTIGVVLGLRGT